VEWLESAESLGGQLGSEPPPSPVPSTSGWPDQEEEEPSVVQLSAVAQQQQQLPAARRQKTTSECTESSISQTMLETGPSPLEPSFQLPGSKKYHSVLEPYPVNNSYGSGSVNVNYEFGIRILPRCFVAIEKNVVKYGSGSYCSE
jgi:hypothetical protein